MPDDPKPATDEPIEPASPEAAASQQNDEDIGDFITRHVLEKDSVFFEG